MFMFIMLSLHICSTTCKIIFNGEKIHETKDRFLQIGLTPNVSGIAVYVSINMKHNAMSPYIS